MSRIGVVTVTHDSDSVLADFLESLRLQTHSDFIIYIVDSGSSDRTVEILQAISDPRVRCIFSKDNIGFAAGSNLGIIKALDDACDTVMLLNNDTTFGPDLLQGLLEGLDKNNCDMCTPKMLYFEPPNTIWAAGGSITKWLGYRSHHLGMNRIDDGSFDKPRRITFVPFCCVLIRKSVFSAIGYLDERFFVYGEDVDYCYRALREDIRLWYVPQCRLRHKVSTLTGGAMSEFTLYHACFGRALFLIKNLGRLRGALWNRVYVGYCWIRMIAGRDTLTRYTARSTGTRAGEALAVRSQCK